MSKRQATANLVGDVNSSKSYGLWMRWIPRSSLSTSEQKRRHGVGSGAWHPLSPDEHWLAHWFWVILCTHLRTGPRWSHAKLLFSLPYRVRPEMRTNLPTLQGKWSNFDHHAELKQVRTVALYQVSWLTSSEPVWVQGSSIIVKLVSLILMGTNKISGHKPATSRVITACHISQAPRISVHRKRTSLNLQGWMSAGCCWNLARLGTA